MIGTSPLQSSQNNRQPLTDCSHPPKPSDPNPLMVSTVTSDYKLKFCSTQQRCSPTLPPEVTFSSSEREERMEIEDKARGFCSPKQNIAALIRSYRNFRANTRQTVAIAGISVASLLALLAIFYVTKLFQGNENTGETVMIEQTLQKHLEVDIQSGEFEGDEKRRKSEYEINHNFKVLKTKDGKAVQHDPSLHGLSIAPMFPKHNEDEVEEYSNDRHSISEKEIVETLNIVRKTVDADRKMILNKELRMWVPGAEQLRVLLVSTWQSGANYLSEILQAHPGVFQHYEPLSYIGPRQVRSGKEAFQAQQVVHRLLDCKYENLNDYMNFTKTHLRDTIGHNENVWKSCKKGRNEMTCADPGFLSTACKMFPVQLVKTVRLRLNLTHLLLNDQKLRVKVLFMVRDPREIMNSRLSNIDWCLSSSDCSSAEALCRDMQGDLKVSSAFEKLYPHRFLKIKYEDLLQNTETEVGKIISFLNLEFSKTIRNFMKEKPFEDSQGNLKNLMAPWKRDLPLQKIYDIQNACSDVLEELKYDILD